MEMKEILNHMQANIYITDVENNEILFMNQKMKKDYGFQNPEGMKCWEVFQVGKKERCEFCKIPELLKSKDPASCITWEENNTKLGRVFENHDSLIVWKGKKLICSRPMILQKCFSLQNVQPEILFVMCGTEQAERRCWKKKWRSWTADSPVCWF